MTVGDLEVINQREREKEKRAVSESSARMLERQKARKYCTAAGVCVYSCQCVLLTQAAGEHDSNCLVSVLEVRFLESESRAGPLTDWFTDWITSHTTI